MKKLLLLFTISFFASNTFAQSYLESLSKLNKYLETYGSDDLGPIEIKEGYFISYSYHKKKYHKVKMEDLAAATINEKFNYAVLECKNRDKCIYSTLSKSKIYSADYWATDRNDVITLVQLLNDFISSYDKEMGIDYVVLSTTGCVLGNCENGTGEFIYPDKSKYYGVWKNGKREGSGAIYQKNGIVIRANWQNDAIVGKGTITYSKEDPVWGGESVYEGEIKDNLPNGEGILFIYNPNYKNKTTLKGNFVNGKLNGKGEFYDLVLDTKTEKMEKSYSGNFKDGLYDGYGIYKKTSHYPKAQKKGMDDIETYEGNWKEGKKEGTGKYFNNNIHLEQEYTGEWKNDLKNGKGICIYKEEQKNDEGLKDGNRYEGTWINGSEDVGKLTTNTGYVLYEGGKKERDLYWNKVYESSSISNEAAIKSYEAGQKERDELAERVRLNNEAKKNCVCDKCGGSGKTTFKSAKLWDSDVYENGKKVGTVRNSGWEYEEVTCTRCLGTGKCK